MKLPVIYKTAEEALSVIKSGDRVFVHGSAQTPHYLLRELAKMAPGFRTVELTFNTIQGEIEVVNPQYVDSFLIN